jgi:hypothetical protein
MRTPETDIREPGTFLCPEVSYLSDGGGNMVPVAIDDIDLISMPEEATRITAKYDDLNDAGRLALRKQVATTLEAESDPLRAYGTLVRRRQVLQSLSGSMIIVSTVVGTYHMVKNGIPHDTEPVAGQIVVGVFGLLAGTGVIDGGVRHVNRTTKALASLRSRSERLRDIQHHLVEAEDSL